MPSGAEFKRFADIRLAEATVLYQNGHYDWAKYTLGYVVEAALKARVCKVLDMDYPDSGVLAKVYLTHKIDTLVKLGGLQKTLDSDLTANIDFKTNWSIATSWTEATRYNSIGSCNKEEIENMIAALVDNDNGVLTWIKRKW